MTVSVVAGRPAPGEVWAGRTARWRVLPSGLLVQLGDDNPGAGVTVEEAAAVDGPLRPPARRARVAVLLDRADAVEAVVV